MKLFRRGTLILDEKSDDAGGKTADEQDVDTDDSTKNKSDDETKDGGSGDTSAKTQDKTDDTSTSDEGKDDATKGTGDSDNDDLTKASAVVAKKYRQAKAENVGLKGQVAVLSEVEEENERLKGELAKAEDANIKLELAGKYGVNPKMLDPIQGDKESLEVWLRENVGQPKDTSTKDAGSAETDTDEDGKKTDTKDTDDAGKTDETGKTDDSGKSDESKDKSDDEDGSGNEGAKDIDGNRPEKVDVETAPISALTVEQLRERSRKNL